MKICKQIHTVYFPLTNIGLVKNVIQKVFILFLLILSSRFYEEQNQRGVSHNLFVKVWFIWLYYTTIV